MTINVETIDTIVKVISAAALIGGIVFGCYRWYLKQNKQTAEIVEIKEENALICYGLHACLDGLVQLGANHEVTKAKDKLEKHLNVNAHK